MACPNVYFSYDTKNSFSSAYITALFILPFENNTLREMANFSAFKLLFLKYIYQLFSPHP